MKQNFYILNNGRLRRQENTIFFEKEDGSKAIIPIENTEAIYAFGELDFNTKSSIIWLRREYLSISSIITVFIRAVIIRVRPSIQASFWSSR